MSALLKSLSSQAGSVFRFFVSGKDNQDKQKQRDVDALEDNGNNHVDGKALLNQELPLDRSPVNGPSENQESSLESLSRPPTSLRCPSTSSNQISKDVSTQDNGYKSVISRKRKRQERKLKTRRLQMRWTEEEVAKLEEGMKIYGTPETSKILWKKILEFGVEVVDKCRKPGDPKDKWRNMLKGDERILQGCETFAVQCDKNI